MLWRGRALQIEHLPPRRAKVTRHRSPSSPPGWFLLLCAVVAPSEFAARLDRGQARAWYAFCVTDEEDSARRGESTQRPEAALALAPTAPADVRSCSQPPGPARGAEGHTQTSTGAPTPGAVVTPAGELPLHVGAAVKHYEIIRLLGQGGMGTV